MYSKKKVTVINCSALKPFDNDTIIASVRKTGCAVTAENHSIIGGTGSAVAECLSEHCPAPMKRIGIMDKYGESGSLEELFPKFGLTTEKVVEAALLLLKK